MESLRGLTFHGKNGKTWVSLTSFLTYLKQNSLQSDKYSNFKRYNVLREIKKFGNEILIDEDNNTELISLAAILKFVFKHSDDIYNFGIIASEITAFVFEKPQTDTLSVLHLYKELSKHKFKHLIPQIYTEKIEVPETDSVFSEYEKEFNTTEWFRIRLFEFHFSQINPTRYSFEETLKKKWEYFQYLKTCEQFANQSTSNAAQVINVRQKRMQTTEQHHKFTFVCNGQKHQSSGIEKNILAYLKLLYQDKIALIGVAHCPPLQPSPIQKVDIFIVLGSDFSNIQYLDVIQTVTNRIATLHNLNCNQIAFFQSKHVEHFVNKEEDYLSRYQLQDAFYSGSAPETTFQVLCSEILSEYSNNGDIPCPECFPCNDFYPLEIKTFDVLIEWCLHTPIDIQIFLNSFINKTSLKRSIGESLGQLKIERLYAVYDTLLNISNKRYIGILQKDATNDLLMNYSSVTSVFDVTSKFGLTNTFDNAEAKLKARAKIDICHFDTFIRQYQLSYESVSGHTNKAISLRECHLILMLDNLVRLLLKRNPTPDQTRTNQLCTLPITIQGLPKDSKLIKSWHHPTLCNGTPSCSCKLPTKLTEDDVRSSLFDRNDEEKTIYQNFTKAMTWGLKQRISCFRDLLFQKNDNTIYSGDEDCKSDLDDETLSEVGNDFFEMELWHLENSEDDDTMGHKFEEDVEFNNSEPEDAGEEDSDVCDNDESTESDEGLSAIVHGLVSKRLIATPAEMTDDLSILENSLNILNISRETTNEASASHTSTKESAPQVFTTESAVQALTTKKAPQASTKESTSQDSTIESSFLALNSELASQTSFTNVIGDKPGAGRQDKREDENIFEIFGLSKFTPPPLLCRHPPPERGRDDDIIKLKDILDNILVCTGQFDTKSNDRILCGPDNKIGNNLLSLVARGGKYKKFLPEFPLLHLRKCKINILHQAYREAGIVELLMYMRDDTTHEWDQLISSSLIDTATKYIKRLGLSLRLALIVSFGKSLAAEEKLAFADDWERDTPVEIDTKWMARLTKFIEEGCKANATFQLHCDMLIHCEEVVALSVAERLGGHTGYSLLLGVVKASLPFLYLNGASSYAGFCTKLLHAHASAGYFHKNMKESLFSTPIDDSNENFACDTKREMDHKNVNRSFRSGSSIGSVTYRMSLVDDLKESHDRHHRQNTKLDNSMQSNCRTLTLEMDEVDLQHIIPTTEMIVRRGGFSSSLCSMPFNIYTSTPQLPPEILDVNSYEVGEYLATRFLLKENLFHLPKEYLNDKHLNASSDLISRAKRSNGTTLRRVVKTRTEKCKRTSAQIDEDKRQQAVKRKNIQTDCLLSKMNACQALVKPNCTKPKIQKSQTMVKALLQLMKKCSISQQCIQQNVSLTQDLTKDIVFITVEFAGVKFQTKSCSGTEYIHNIQSTIINQYLYDFQGLQHAVICEEKYSYTPDDLKSLTHEQRKKAKGKTIAHLKTKDKILSSSTFDREAIITTREGKSLVSCYLAANAEKLRVQRSFSLDIDSELHIQGCTCNKDLDYCICDTSFSTPIRCSFTETSEKPQITKLSHIKQNKGEAEMSQIDWLIDYAPSLQQGEAVASVVTSGDIDSVVIHLYVISTLWPRNPDGTFKNKVYVLLKKRNKLYDVYNITLLLEQLEKSVNDIQVGVKLAIGLCIGGNDFIPKYFGITHSKIIELIFSDDHEFYHTLFESTENNGTLVNPEIYALFVMHLYSRPGMLNSSFNDIRQKTMVATKKSGTTELRNAKLWLPPRSVLLRVAKLVNLQIEYLDTAGRHFSKMPKFLASDTLRKNTDGRIEYDFGPEVMVQAEELLTEHSTKRQLDYTPKKGKGKKKQLTSTPNKGKDSKSGKPMV